MSSNKMEYVLKGLDCANCAAKIETKVNGINGIDSASVDFVSGKLTVETKDEYEIDHLVDQIKTIVRKTDQDIQVIEKRKTDHTKQGIQEHTHEQNDGNHKKELIRILIGAAFFAVAVIFSFSEVIEFTLFFLSYALVGAEVLWKAVKNIFRGQVFDENFLMSVATIGAFAIKLYPEGVAVMLFYQIGEFIQNIAVNRSRKSIGELMDIRPDYANLMVGNEAKRVSPEQVKEGDVILVKPGEKVPLDGKVLDGKSMVDTSALTGESTPREIEAGTEVLSGFINLNGVLRVEVTKNYGESTVAKILDLVENASSRKAPTENFITKFARYYTPVVVFIAVSLAVVPPIAVQGASFSDWLYRALIFLVVSCPCALVISIPLGFFGGIGAASKRGILVKGSNYLEALNRVDTVVFDKTGTLTKGVFNVTDLQPRSGFTKAELLEFAALAESYSNHPIAVSILKEYGKKVLKDEIDGYDEISGHGMKVTAKGHEILAGNDKLMEREHIAYENNPIAGTVVLIAVDGKFAGSILISDIIKEDAKEAITSLKQLGINRTVMLTGDNTAIAGQVSEQLGLDAYYAELLPNQKVEEIELLDQQKSKNGKLLFVGDGINDAPVLARADVGIAMGGLGSDAAIEAADVVIMTDEPSKIATAIKIAKRTRMIVWQNIFLAMIVKLIVLALGAGGIATIWEAVFADVGVTLLAVLNAMRVFDIRNVK